MTPGRPESGGALTNDSEVKGPGCDRFRYRPAILGGIFMPLPWSALANPLEPLRGRGNARWLFAVMAQFVNIRGSQIVAFAASRVTRHRFSSDIAIPR
jgi:hypothetical protein